MTPQQDAKPQGACLMAGCEGLRAFVLRSSHIKVQNETQPTDAWMMAYLYSALHQAMVCFGGSIGEIAFRESLRPQYSSSERHHAKGLRTYPSHCEKSTRGWFGVDSREMMLPSLGKRGGGSEEGQRETQTKQDRLLLWGHFCTPLPVTRDGSYAASHQGVGST